MADTYNLEAQSRTIVGKKVGQLRRQGIVPVVVYGSALKEAVNLQVPYRPLQVALAKAGGTHLIEISADGSTHTVLARAVQRDVIKGDILHVDFLAVDLTQKITTNVQIRLVGESPAAESRTGILSQVVNSLTVEALPSDLIDHVPVDISSLREVGDSIHIRDIDLGGKVTILDEADELIVHITAISEAPSEDELEAEAAAAAAEPEVIRREREEDED